MVSGTGFGKKVEDTDPGDIHVMLAAVQHNCDLLATYNVDDFPTVFCGVEVVRPDRYYDYLMSTTDMSKTLIKH